MRWLAQAISVLVCISTIAASSAEARRLPEPGGDVRVLIANVAQFENAHLSLRLLERDRRATQPSDGPTAGWRSDVLEKVENSGQAKRWVVVARAYERLVLKSLKACLIDDKEAWPARVLATAGVKVVVGSDRGQIVISLSSPVGALPDLLSGCWLQISSKALGPFQQGPGGVLRASTGLAPRPLLNEVRVVGEGQRADIRAGQVGVRASGRVIAAPYPDVLMVVQRGKTLELDPLEVGKPAKLGLAGFYRHLSAGVQVAHWAGGRGAATRGLLPAGIADPHPLPRVALEAEKLPMALGTEGASRGTVNLHFSDNDRVAKGFADRLQMLLLSRGVGWTNRHDQELPSEGLVVYRWRAPTRDPGISVLELMSRFDELRLPDSGLLARLVAADRSVRLEAALEVQRQWINACRVLPLATLDLWYDVRLGLEDVWISDEGVPVLDRAFWREGP